MARWMMTADGVRSLGWPDMPLIVLSDNMKSFVSWRIKRHTSGEYNHAMLMAEPGLFTSQNAVYEQMPVDSYLDGKHRLKFWRGKQWTARSLERVQKHIHARMDGSWFKRLYDPFGVLGHRLYMKWSQIPGLYYCSEDVAVVLYMLEPTFNLRRPSPADINRWCKAHPEIMQEVGVYDPNYEQFREWHETLEEMNR